ncbi:hypothetical protein B0H16DRAFT_1744923 [Mycena metata]|uniref:Uncharacterized protein n=1 Tax=Mycena metata TaxID=1033252 RepID=A0AAD7H3W2_9AGAR|nr:hypothetical protein B0H16DRAFT_1744923 [Mycena metata]
MSAVNLSRELVLYIPVWSPKAAELDNDPMPPLVSFEDDDDEIPALLSAEDLLKAQISEITIRSFDGTYTWTPRAARATDLQKGEAYCDLDYSLKLFNSNEHGLLSLSQETDASSTTETEYSDLFMDSL